MPGLRRGSSTYKVPPYIYTYDFRNKTLATIQADGWTSYDNTPSFDSEGMYSTASNDIRIKIPLRNNISGKKIIITLNYKWNNTQPGVNFGINLTSDNSGYNGVYLQGTARNVTLNGTAVYSINNAPDTAGTYSETITYDLVNKTYNVSGHWSYSGNLTDEQISAIRNTTGLCVQSYKSSSVRVCDVTLKIER